MSRYNTVYLGYALRQFGPLAVLGSAFLLGGLLGSGIARFITGDTAQNLKSFLLSYLSSAQAGTISASFWSMLWEQGRFFLGSCLLGITALGVVGIPVLFLIRGFLLSFSIAAFCRVFGPIGLAPALFLFGLPAFLWTPALFLTGTQCFEGACALLRRVLGDGRAPLPQNSAYWGRLALYVLFLVACVGLEYAAAPVLLRAAAHFVL